MYCVIPMLTVMGKLNSQNHFKILQSRLCAGLMVLLCMSLFLSHSMVFADLALKSLNKPLHRRWRVEPLVSMPTKDGQMNLRAYQRVIDFRTFKAPVADLTHVELDKPKDTLKPDEQVKAILDVIQPSLGKVKWSRRQQGGAHVYEADWVQGNRYLTLYYRDTGKKISMSFSSVRRIYMVPVLFEMELMQRRLAGVEVKSEKSKKTSALNWLERWATPAVNQILEQLLWPRAQAQVSSIDNLVNQIRGLDSTQLNEVLKSLDAQTRQFLQSGSNAANSFAGAADNVGNAAQQLPGQIDQGLALGNRAVDQVEGIRGDARQISNDVTASVDNAAKTGEAAVKRLTSFKTAFIMGLGGAIGAGVGTMVVNFTANGVVNVVSSAYRAITGRIAPTVLREMKERGAVSIEELESSAEELSRLELELDKHIAALLYASERDGQSFGEIARQAQIDEEMEKAEVERLKQEFEKHPYGSGGARYCAQQVIEHRNLAQGFGAIVPILSKAAYEEQAGRDSGKAALCNEIKELLNRWVSAENALNTARESLVSNAAVVAAEMNNHFVESYTEKTSGRRKRKHCQRSIKRLRNEVPNESSDPRYRQHSLYSIDNMRMICEDIVEIEASVNPAVAYANGLTVASQNMTNFRNELKELASAHCRPGEQSPACNGEEGAFNQLTNRYNKLVSVAQQFCPRFQQTMMQTLPDVQPLAAAGLVPEQKPKKGVMSRVGGFFKNSVGSIARKVRSWWPF